MRSTLYHVATVEGVMHGLYVMWWVREKHVSVAAVAAILAAGDLFVSLVEIPTGWLADRYGHRASLVAGSFLQIVGMLFAWLGSGIPGILASSLTIAAGDAFRCGADQALLYRTCAALDEELSFQRIEARSRALQLGSMVGLILLGGAIVERWGFAAGWFVETLLSAVGLALAWAMVEPPPAKHEDAADLHGAQASEGTAKKLRFGQLRLLMTLIVPAAMLGGAVSAMTFSVQADGQEALRMTMFVAVVTLMEAAGAFAGGYFAGGARTQMMLAGIGAGLGAIVLGVPAALLPIAIALCFLMGVSYPLRSAAIQRLASDHVRAQAASLASAVDKACMTIALVFVGWLRR